MKFLILAAVLVAGTYATLTADEAKLVKGSWDKVKAQEDGILYVIFKENPDIQAKFPAFVGKNIEEIKSSDDFKKHADRIVTAVSKYVDLLGNEANTPAIKTLLNELGQSHKSRGATKEQFEKFKASVVKYLKEHSGNWTDATGAAWNKAFEEMYAIVFSNLDGNPVN